MKTDEINRIIEKNTAIYPLGYAIFEIHEEIMANIASALCAKDDQKELLRITITLKVKNDAFISLLLDQAEKQIEKTVPELPIGKNIVDLYESCEWLCEFLTGMYDRAPEYVRTRLSRDDLTANAVQLQAEREDATKCLNENRGYLMPTERPITFRSLIDLTIITILGEEQHCFFVAEVSDAFAIVRSHPKCASFFRENQ